MPKRKIEARWSGLLLVGLLLVGLSCSEPSRLASTPKLVVVVVVDQMRADYLDRFRSQFSGGLDWLVENGVLFSNVHHDHAITATGPGHATIATGVFPSRHGIVGNDFYDRMARRIVYSFADSTSAILNHPKAAGRSPVNLLREGLADWLKEGSPESKVYSVAIKDRAAIPLAGKRPDGAYWYDTSTGDFVTSAYYRAEYPGWVEAFNQEGRSERYCNTEWTPLLPDTAYTHSREDDFPAEETLISRTFPHLLTGTDGTADARYFARLPETPFGDELTLEFAGELLVNEGLGLDEHVDLLFVGLSSADYIGHGFGPYSREIQDYYLRLDGMLADFFAQVEGAAGPGGYVIALTGDHGVLAMPEELSRRGYEAGRTDKRAVRADLLQVLTDAVQSGLLPEAPRLREAAGFVLDFGSRPPSGNQEAALRDRMAEALRRRRDIGAAFSYDQLTSGSGAGELFEMYVRSFHPDRAADIFYAPLERHLITTEDVGTSHGSPYEYDTHVPLIFAGAGIAPAHRGRFARTVDIAPTLSGVLNLSTPPDVDGRDLQPLR